MTTPATDCGVSRSIAPRTTKTRIPAASASARKAEPQLVVDPSKNAIPKPLPRLVPREPSTPHMRSAPTVAPTSCAATYAGTSRHGKRRVAASATVTAGLMWEPEIGPST